jgi:hypothetical protein
LQYNTKDRTSDDETDELIGVTMARKAKKKHENLYSIVEKLRANPKQSSRNKQKFNFRDPTALRALRIHRHLKALENDILNPEANHEITLQIDAQTNQIVISIRNTEVHCCRNAFLTDIEFRLLRKNRKVLNKLKKCKAWKDVA